MEVSASLSSDSGLSAGFLLMRNGNKRVFGIKLELGFAAGHNLPGEQPRGDEYLSPVKGKCQGVSGIRVGKISERSLRAICRDGCCSFTRTSGKKSCFVLPGHLVCSPLAWPCWLVEGSHDLVLQQKLGSLHPSPKF